MSETGPSFPFGQTEDSGLSNELRRMQPEAEVRRTPSSDGAKTSQDDEVAASNNNRSSFSSSSSSLSPWHRVSESSDNDTSADHWMTGQEWTEVDFDGQRHNVSVIKCHPLRHMTSQSLPVSVDRMDVVPLGGRGPVFVLPRWYMFEDKASKRITLVEPEVIKDTLKQMINKNSGQARSSGKTMNGGKSRSSGGKRSRDWKLVIAENLKSVERLRIDEAPISSDPWREDEVGRESYSVDNSSASSLSSSPSSSSSSNSSSSLSQHAHETGEEIDEEEIVNQSIVSTNAPPTPPSPLSTPHFFPAASSDPSSHSDETAMSSSVRRGGEEGLPVGSEEEGTAKIHPHRRGSEGGWTPMGRTTVQPNVLHRILFISQRQLRP